MRSLRKYSREFQYLYPSGLLNVLIRDGECLLTLDSFISANFRHIAIIFFTVSLESLYITTHYRQRESG